MRLQNVFRGTEKDGTDQLASARKGVCTDMDNKIRIGIVILAWNSERVIGKCLRSITGLKEVSAYTVIIDNGSTDSTPAILDEYTAGYPGSFSVIRHSKNIGTTITRNQGIKKNNYTKYADLSVKSKCLVAMAPNNNTDIKYIAVVERVAASVPMGIDR